MASRTLPLMAAFMLLGLRGAGAAGERGEPIREIRVRENVRTSSDTVRALAEVKIGDPLGTTTLESLRRRLLDSYLFSDVYAFWEPVGGGARITVVARDRLPWVPTPTFVSYPGERVGGLRLTHENLFDRGAQGFAQGRLSTVDSGGAAGVVGAHGFFEPALQVDGARTWIPEYGNDGNDSPAPVRSSTVTVGGVGIRVGLRLWDRFFVAGRYRLEYARVGRSGADPDNADAPSDLDPAARTGRRGQVGLGAGLDDLSMIGPLRLGVLALAELSFSSRQLGSGRGFSDWRLDLRSEYAMRVLSRHNFIVTGDVLVSRDLPLWAEPTVGGLDVRGIRYRRYQGDTRIGTQIAHHLPLLDPGPFELRAVGFVDAAALWFRSLPGRDITGAVYDPRSDGRQFLPNRFQKPGFDITRDLHASIGAGLRGYLRHVTSAAVGIDVAYAVPDRSWGVIIVVGR